MVNMTLSDLCAKVNIIHSGTNRFLMHNFL